MKTPPSETVSLSSCSVSLHILHIISLAGGSSAGLGPYPSIHPCASSSSIRWTLCLSIVVGWQSACGRLLGPCFLPGLWRGGLDRPRIIICLGQISFQALRERIPTGEKWSVSSQAPSLRMMIYWHQTGDDDGENVEWYDDGLFLSSLAVTGVFLIVKLRRRDTKLNVVVYTKD